VTHPTATQTLKPDRRAAARVMVVDPEVVAPASRSRGEGRTLSISGVLAFIGAHVLLGVAISQVPTVGTLHGAATVLVAVFVSFTSRGVDRIITMACYCATCDVLWRMSRSAMPWEAAKYLTMLLLATAFFRFVRRPHSMKLPLILMALLVPSCITSVVVLGPEARSQIAANLAGPFALAVAVIVFRQVRATERELSYLLWAMTGPVITISTIATRSTLGSGAIKFSDGSSNFTASGGFGPNQVSNLLSIGALACVALCFSRTTIRLIVVQIALGTWFTVQAALTFSRGGLYSLAVAVLAIVVVSLATHGMRARVAVAVAVATLLVIAAFPAINSFTGGSLGARFANTANSNRDEIANADLELFTSSPIFGVGVGVAKYERASTDAAFTVQSRAHTEYSRLLAEHGVLGLLAALLLVSMAIQGFRSVAPDWNRTIAVGFAAWALVTMAHSATSVGAISLAFGLIQLRIAKGTRDFVASVGAVAKIDRQPQSS